MITLARVPPFIATLSTLFAFQGLALVITGGVDIDLSAMPPGFLAIGQGKVFGFPIQILLYVAVLAVFAFTQHRTRFGRRLYLIGTNERAAILSGLRPGRLRASCYIVAGGVAALAAVINAARLGVARPDTLDNANLVSIAAVVLGGTAIFGGTGSVVGTALATVVIAVIDYGLSYSNVNSIYQAGAIGIILILVMFSETAIRFIPRFSGNKA
jgi:ribose/xylose/arabinose/galactoside ABC-type transport system permease subunit